MCGDCGEVFMAELEPDEYGWPECKCPSDHFQLIGWKEVRWS